MAPSYLVKKGDIYYFRHYIPLRMQVLVGKKEFVRTIKVTHKYLAIRISRELKIIFDSIMDKYQQIPSITWKEICEIVDHAFDIIYQKYVKNVDVYGLGHHDKYDPLNYIPPEYEEYVFQCDDKLEWGDIGNISELADKIVEWAKWDINKNSREYQLLCFRTIQMLYQHRDKKVNPTRHESNILHEINENIQSLASKASVSICSESAGSGYPLLKLYKNYVDENRGAWSDRTRIEKEGLFINLIFPLVEIATGKSLDNISVQDIDNQVVNRYVDSLRLLPAQFNKRFKNKLTLSEALDYAIKLDNKEVVSLDIKIIDQLNDKISSSTINGTYLQLLSALLKHGVTLGYLEKNYLENRSIKAGQFDKKTFRPFEYSELTTIFSNEIFSKKLIKTKMNEYSNKIPYFKFWVPVLGLYTGARENELAQLTLEDIDYCDGIHCLKVALSKDKRVKNKSSIRSVPLHPELMKLGFIKYVNWLRAKGDDLLFPEMVNKKDKGSVVSKWFSRLIHDKCQILNNDPMTLIGFHSFRNNFSDEYKQKEAQKYISGEIMGHKTEGMTYGVYGSLIKVSVAYNSLIKYVTYEGLDLPWNTNPDYHKIKFPWDD